MAYVSNAHVMSYDFTSLNTSMQQSSQPRYEMNSVVTDYMKQSLAARRAPVKTDFGSVTGYRNGAHLPKQVQEKGKIIEFQPPKRDVLAEKVLHEHKKVA